MCGDFDDQERIDDELFERFIELIKQFGVAPALDVESTPDQLDTESQRARYMEKTFKDGLTTSVIDAANLARGERMDVLAGNAIVFARLAGFLTAQFPPETDLFRTISRAVLDGYEEGGRHS